MKVNGILVKPLYRVPDEPPMAEDPGEFEWTGERKAKGFHKSGFAENAFERFRFWEDSLGFEAACLRLETYVRRQPLVKKVERGAPGQFGLMVTSIDGETQGYGVGRKVPREKLLQRRLDDIARLKDRAARERDHLEKGGVWLIGRMQVQWPSHIVQRDLPRLVEILSMTLPAQKKAALLKQERFPFQERDFDDCFGRFRSTPSLEKRIKHIVDNRPDRMPPRR